MCLGPTEIIFCEIDKISRKAKPERSVSKLFWKDSLWWLNDVCSSWKLQISCNLSRNHPTVLCFPLWAMIQTCTYVNSSSSSSCRCRVSINQQDKTGWHRCRIGNLLIVVNSLPVLSLVAKSVGSIVLKSPARHCCCQNLVYAVQVAAAKIMKVNKGNH